jgi:hypothetical protein
LKIKQQGGQTGRKLLDEMSDDGVGKDDGIDRERERKRTERARRAKQLTKWMVVTILIDVVKGGVELGEN